MKLRPILLAAGVLGAAWLAFFGDKTPTTDIAEPAVPAAAAPKAAAISATAGSAAQARRAPAILALQARQNLIGGAHDAPAAAGLFAAQSWAPPPPPPAKTPPPPPPAAPPLPFIYLGKKIEDGAWEAYLARGDRTLIAREQSVIDGIYRIDSIKPPTLSLTYLPLKQVQTLTIGGTD